MSLIRHNDNNLPEASGRALVPYQEKAVALLKEVGLPSRRDETWRPSQKMALLSEEELPLAEKFYLDSVQKSFLSDFDSYKIIFINGYYAENLSDPLPEGVSFSSLAQAVQDRDASLGLIDGISAPYDQGYKHLNSVMCRDGAILNVAKDTIIDKPIHLVFKNISEKTVAYGRVLIQVESNAKVQFMAEHITTASQHENHVAECYIGAGAQVSYIKIAADMKDAAHIGSFSADIARDATFNLGFYGFGSNFCRTETNIYLSGQGANANFGAANYISQTDMNEHISTFIHNVPHCNSSQLFQSLCDDRGRSVVQSKTIVARDAQKTDGHQMLRALLLSDKANAFAKPELEIYADDVKCAHGSAVGQLDADAIFYLRARSIPLSEAKALLTRAFMSEALSVIDNEELSERLIAHFSDTLLEDFA